MTITAKNIGRINVWPTYDAAREADTEECEFICGLTVYRTNAEARANLTSGGNGGGELDWVPEGAKIHIDLVRAFNEEDAAWTAADGVVAVDTLLGGDVNAESGWGDETAYDAADLTENGYVTSTAPAFIGSLRSSLLAGATLRCSWRTVSHSTTEIFIPSADGVDALDVTIHHGDDPRLSASSYNGPFNIRIYNIANYSASGALNAVAITLTDARIDIAINGCDATTDVLAAEDRPGDNPLVAALIWMGGSNALQSITLYDALPSTTGLSELSETGVTNTAPHDLVGIWNSVGEDAFFAEDVFTVASSEDPENILDVSATDDEGNPLAISVSSAHADTFQTTAGTVQVITPLAVGDYAFTVRATDPGGLYVEQEFTITVTA